MSDLARDAAWLRKLADLIGPLKDERALVRLREIAGRLDGVAALSPDIAVELARQANALTAARELRKTAGDLLIAAVDRWALHAMSCQQELCDTCDVAINQLRLAYKVWQVSAHREAS